MSLKSIILFIVGTLGVMGLVVALLWQFGANTGKPIADVAGKRAHVSGSGPVEIVEFSDFQCPACGAVQDPLKQLLEKYGEKVTFVYRHFPLTSIHPYAQIAAQASEAAGMQGKFTAMHDLLFARQTTWSKSDPSALFVEYAKELGLDTDKFAIDLNSQTAKDLVNVDAMDATRFKIAGTPTFYVNGIEMTFDKIEAKILELAK